jgi:Tol biopolymer transport system component
MRVPLLVVLVTASLPLASARPLVATPADETSPATNGADLAWTRGSKDDPVIVMKLGEVFLSHAGGRPVRITPAGVLAASGGMDARTLVVQVILNGRSDLELFDLKTRRFRKPPRGVNTRAWEWRGSISGRRLLFGRFNGVDTYDIVLADLSTGRERILDSVRGHGAYAEPGQVSGRYAVWAGCPDNFCTVYRYDISNGSRLRVPGDYRHVAYAPSVAASGDVYYGYALRGCGSSVQLRRFRQGEGSRVLQTLADGYDFRFTNTDGRRVLFDRVHCSHGNFDIFAASAG